MYGYLSRLLVLLLVVGLPLSVRAQADDERLLAASPQAIVSDPDLSAA